MNLPNELTLLRLFLIPVFILTFFSNISNSFIISIVIFLIAGATDILDGYIARKNNLITKWGIIFDPFADKLMLITVLSCLVIANYIPIWVLIIMIIKESLLISAGIFLLSKDTVVPSNFAGKLSTALFYLSIFILIFNVQIGIYLIYISVISALFAFTNYLLLYKKNSYRSN